MNEKMIQDAIWIEWGRRSKLMCPCFTPPKWWECDMYRVTEAGYSVEYEIKLSLSDFRADAKKEREVWDMEKFRANLPPEKETKHGLLAAHSDRGPSRFFFVVPHTLPITVEMVPVWAGLLTLEKSPCGYQKFTEVKGPPTLHRKPVDEWTINACLRSTYYRFWSLRTRLKTDDSATVKEEAA